MRSRCTSRFWGLYHALPASVQKVAEKNYLLWKSDPRHPSLHFKRLKGSGNRFSVRIGGHYRAIGWETEADAVEWVWIGTHAEYDKLVSGM